MNRKTIILTVLVIFTTLLPFLTFNVNNGENLVGSEKNKLFYDKEINNIFNTTTTIDPRHNDHIYTVEKNQTFIWDFIGDQNKNGVEEIYKFSIEIDILDVSDHLMINVKIFDKNYIDYTNIDEDFNNKNVWGKIINHVKQINNTNQIINYRSAFTEYQTSFRGQLLMIYPLDNFYWGEYKTSYQEDNNFYYMNYSYISDYNQYEIKSKSEILKKNGLLENHETSWVFSNQTFYQSYNLSVRLTHIDGNQVNASEESFSSLIVNIMTLGLFSTGGLSIGVIGAIIIRRIKG